MVSFMFYNPVTFIFGRGKIEEIGVVAKPFGSKALIVTTPSSRSVRLAKKVRTLLLLSGVECEVFNECVVNPLLSVVRKGTKIAKEAGCDLVIGLGGGSVIDTAKAIAFMVDKPDDVADYIFGDLNGDSALPLIAITTTAGAATESNRTTVIINDETKDKKGFVSTSIFPKASIFDTNLMATLPKPMISAPGLDSMFHAFESYISKKANPVSETLAIQSIKLSVEYLPKVYEDPKDLDAWDQVALANLLSGMAISGTSSTLGHALAQPIGGLNNSIHGECLSAVYIPFMKYTAPYAVQKFALIARILSQDAVLMTDEEAATKCSQYMKKFFEKLDMVKTLGEVGVKESQIEWLVNSVVTTMAPQLICNPIIPDSSDIEMLYRSCL